MLGVMALLDEEETDWKVIVIDVSSGCAFGVVVWWCVPLACRCVLVCCWCAAGVLLVYCWCAAGVLLFRCWLCCLLR